MEEMKAGAALQRVADDTRRMLGHDLRPPDELDLLADAVLGGVHPAGEAGCAQDHADFVAALRRMFPAERPCSTRHRPAPKCGIAS